MQSPAAVRLTANLNSLLHRQQRVEQAERGIRGDDVAHHVVDPSGVLGLDPIAATPLDDALEALIRAESEGWFLALPVPGVLAPLSGPPALNSAALDSGEAVVASSGGIGLVPHTVGSAVQWEVFAARRPQPPATPYEAERMLSEAILTAASALTQLDVAAGPRPSGSVRATLAPGYSARRQAAALRALSLVAACDAALTSDGASLSVFESDRRTAELRRVRAAASDALVAAVSWFG